METVFLNPQTRRHVERVIARSRAFYAAETAGHFLVRARWAVDSPPVPPLNSFDLDRQLTQWLDVNLESERPGWQAQIGLDDDSMPATCPWFGIAEHSAWLGADVILQESTSLPVPMIRSPADLDRLTLSEDNRWFQYMKAGYEHLRRRQDGTFVLAVRGTMAPMDLANAIRGDEFLIDVALEPEFVHRLLAVLVRATRWYYSHLLSWADDLADGHVFMLGRSWAPSPCLGHISNDAAMLCSPQVYSQFGLPYERELSAGYDRVLFHVHNEKMHFVPELCRLEPLKLLEVSRDPRTVPPIEDAGRILAASPGANLMIAGTSKQLRKHIDDFAARNVFFDIRCRDRGDAEDVVALVRSRSAPLPT